jgi:adenylate kinase
MISTGDIIRAEIKSGSEVGKKVQEIAHVGHLVPDEIVFSLLRKRLSHDDTTHGYILDGFPRRKEQAELLANLEGVSPPNVVVNIGLREDVLITKACARRVCSGCGQGYNLADVRDGEICMPAILPQKENICDNCSGLLIQRDDDVEETVRERLRVYHENAQPLVDFYTAKNLLVDWQVIKGLEDATKLLDTIDEELGKHRD